MDVLTTSLEALLHRASSLHNTRPDFPAIEAFSTLINKETDGPGIAVRLIAQRIQSPHEKEALQALNVLDTCMKQCGHHFHAEVGKFRFLNEMIKLVSPKYLGNRTPYLVRSKVLSLMYSWISEYPKETKIKEAYEMLKKQGVIKDDKSSPEADHSPTLQDECAKSRNTIFEDEEKSKLLQKLLRSKNPEDLQAANRLIKTMVREDERRVEQKSRRSSELQTVHNNVRLLNEMLDSYRPDQVSAGEMELITELHQSCERLRPAVYRLASETQQNEQMLNLTNVGGNANLKRFWSLAKQFDEVLETSIALADVFEKYKKVIKPDDSVPESRDATSANLVAKQVDALLDLTSPLEENMATNTNSTNLTSDLDVLGDIFNSVDQNVSTLNQPSMLKNVLQPISLTKNISQEETLLNLEKTGKHKALEDLDVLSESLLKASLTGPSKFPTPFKKTTEKVSMNEIAKLADLKQLQKDNNVEVANKLDLDFLASGKSNNGNLETNKNQIDDLILDMMDPVNSSKDEVNNACTNNGVSSPDTATLSTNEEPSTPKNVDIPVKCTNDVKKETKLLSDIFVPLESIKPSSIPPINVLDQANGISVVLHFGKDAPREDVAVIVITTINKYTMPISNYLFQAVVPKTCKLKLQPSSGSNLPAHNPFLPGAAITQIMLIANPQKVRVFLKFIISFVLDDETVTEMGEVDYLPSILFST